MVAVGGLAAVDRGSEGLGGLVCGGALGPGDGGDRGMPGARLIRGQFIACPVLDQDDAAAGRAGIGDELAQGVEGLRVGGGGLTGGLADGVGIGGLGAVGLCPGPRPRKVARQVSGHAFPERQRRGVGGVRGGVERLEGRDIGRVVGAEDDQDGVGVEEAVGLGVGEEVGRAPAPGRGVGDHDGAVHFLRQLLLKHGGREVFMIGQAAAVDHAVAEHHDPILVRISLLGWEVSRSHAVAVDIDAVAEPASVLIRREHVLDGRVGDA